MRNRPSIAGATRANTMTAKLMAFLASLALPAAVLAQTQDPFSYWTNNGMISITAYSGSAGSVTIPSVVGGLPVTDIAASVFAQSGSLTNVTIPASVLTIEGSAFAGCTNLVWLYFLGDPPLLSDLSVFDGDTAEVYYMSGGSGWDPFYGGLPTVLLNPKWLRVTINPSSAVAAGAKWKVDAGAWQASGAIVTNLSVGTHTVSFNALGGWTSPASQTVTTTTNLGISVSGSYTFHGLVMNGGFETGDFSGWTFVGDPTGAVVDDGSETGVIPHSGSYEVGLGQVGSLGYLSQTIDTTPGTNYVLSFWLKSDGEAPAEFLVAWNGKTLLDSTNPPASGWQNLQFLVSATKTNTVLQFGFEDDTSYLELDDVSIVPAPANAGLLQVSILPAGATISGAQWQVDGGSLQPSGANIVALSAGAHTVSFGGVSGWTAPTNQSVKINAAQTASITGVYTFLGNYGLVANGGFQTGDFTGWVFNGDPSATFVDDGSQSGITLQSGSYEAVMGQAGSLGYLSQTITTTPGADYLLSFWAYGDGATPNEFLVSWNGKSLFDVTNLPAIGWTNMQFVVGATAASTVLQFGFEDDSGWLAVDDVSVAPGPAPITPAGPAVATNQFGFAISGTSGAVVVVEASASLTKPIWYAVQTNITTGSSYFKDPQWTNYPARFYRLRPQ